MEIVLLICLCQEDCWSLTWYIIKLLSNIAQCNVINGILPNWFCYDCAKYWAWNSLSVSLGVKLKRVKHDLLLNFRIRIYQVVPELFNKLTITKDPYLFRFSVRIYTIFYFVSCLITVKYMSSQQGQFKNIIKHLNYLKFLYKIVEANEVYTVANIFINNYMNIN